MTFFVGDQKGLIKNWDMTTSYKKSGRGSTLINFGNLFLKIFNGGSHNIILKIMMNYCDD